MTDENSGTLFISAKTGTSSDEGFGYEGGILLEKYNVSSSQPGEKNFILYGPSLEINYLSSMIIKGDLSLLLCRGDNDPFAGMQQYAKFIAGRMLNDELSLFILLEYSKSYMKKSAVVMSFADLENYVHLKAGYTVGENTELYLRGGYTKASLKNRTFSEGFDIILGLEISSR